MQILKTGAASCGKYLAHYNKKNVSINREIVDISSCKEILLKLQKEKLKEQIKNKPKIL